MVEQARGGWDDGRTAAGLLSSPDGVSLGFPDADRRLLLAPAGSLGTHPLGSLSRGLLSGSFLVCFLAQPGFGNELP